MKKIIPALALLLISAMVLASASYAWFSMNNSVTVTGMAVKATVSDNLYITASTAGNDKTADANFTSGTNQTVTGTLQPVSTVSGLAGSFFTTTDAAANGSKATETATVPYTAVPGATFEISSTTYNTYVDYVVELKAVNASETTKYVNLSKVNLLYQGSATTNHAFRVAVFAQKQADTDTTLAAGAVTSAYAAISTTAADTILAPASFAYFTSGKAVKTTTTVDTVSPTVNNAGWSTSIEGGKTLYYKVTIRLWLEGEDTDCFNTKFVGLTDDWQLDLAFTLDSNATPAVAQIGSVVNATNTLTTNKFTAALTNGESAATYQWYNGTTNAAIEGQTSADYTASVAIKAYCKITTTEGNVYYTPVVEYTP